MSLSAAPPIPDRMRTQWEDDCPQVSRRAPPEPKHAGTLSQTSSLHNYKEINFYCLNHSVNGIALRKAEQTKADTCLLEGQELLLLGGATGTAVDVGVISIMVGNWTTELNEIDWQECL